MLGLAGFQANRVAAVGRAHDFPELGNLHGSMWAQLTEGIELLMCLADCERVAVMRSQPTYSTGEAILDVYWQTLCAGCTPEDYDVA